MSHIKKKFQFQKVLDGYDLMKRQLESNEENGNSDETTLILNSENLNYEGFEGIFSMLRHTLTLQTILLKNEGNHITINEITKPHEAEKYKNGPVFYTKYVLKTLYQTITDYLYNSDRIKILAFKNIPITNDLPTLCQGIRSNKSIRVLHFEDCDICDDGCIQICQALRKSPIESLGLENCKITLTGASWIAWLIREQSMLRTLTTWNRYQNDYEYRTQQGIRKIVINDNPGIQDSGAKLIISTLFDDDWLTHIHMQNTGMSDTTFHSIIRLLKQNKALSVFDISRNFITSSYVEKIEETLAKRSNEVVKHAVRTRSIKRNVKNKKKNLKKKKSKSGVDKLLSDKSQQTCENNQYSQPFIIVDSKSYQNYNGISSYKQNIKRVENSVILRNKFQTIFNNRNDRVKPLPVIPQQFDPVSHLNKCNNLQSKPPNENYNDFLIENKIKVRRPSVSINLTTFGSNIMKSQQGMGIAKKYSWTDSKYITSFKA